MKGTGLKRANITHTEQILNKEQILQEDPILTMLLHCLSLSALLAVMRGVDCEAEAASRSSLHYNFDHSYGYLDPHNPYLGYKHQHGHHYHDTGEKIISSDLSVMVKP